MLFRSLERRAAMRWRPSTGRSSRKRASSRPEPFEDSSHGAPFEILDQNFWRDADRVADASVLEIAAFAEPVHDRRAHGENLRHLADGQEAARVRAAKMQQDDVEMLPKADSPCSGGWKYVHRNCNKLPRWPYALLPSVPVFTRQGSQVRILQRPP